ncbi:MAG: polyprenyl synthetase family protein [Desulfobacteraceae bacterium]|nr:polyprenyl synthetase family protein [Desulfobacteraceae bacterium]
MSGLKQQLSLRVENDLNDIEAALHENLNPHVELVRDVAGHLIFSGGKRIRPLLNLLCARLCGYTDDFIKKFSTIIEFLHTATLLHDDVVDEAALRRGKPVAHSIWGAPVTVLVGDFLLARALNIAAETGNPRIIQIISEITESMCQGEILQLIKKGDVNLSEADYMDVIRRKTGFLIQGACQTGAILAGAPEDVEARLARYGHHIGMVFQIADDLLDYTADTRTLGKTIGADLKEGKLTLPVIHTLEKAGTWDRSWLAELIARKEFSADEFGAVLRLMHEAGAIDYCRGIAENHVREAKKIIASFPPSQTTETLALIADYTLNRKA